MIFEGVAAVWHSAIGYPTEAPNLPVINVGV